MGPDEIYNYVITKKALAFALRDADGTINGETIDRIQTSPKANEFQAILFVIASGTLTDGTHTVTIEESDDGTTFADAPATAVLGTEPVIAATNDDTVYECAYIGTKRYARLKVVLAGATVTTGGGTVGAVAVLGLGRHVQTR